MTENWPEIEPIPHEKLVQAGLSGEVYAPAAKRQAMTNAERQARFVAGRADIGELPPVADEARRERCRGSVVEFGVAYCLGGSAGLLKRAPSPMLRSYAEDLQRAIEGAGLVHVRFPRGAGKTTWVKIAVLWALAYGHLHYVVAFCANAGLATAILTDIWNVIEFSDAFGADFPEVSWPIRAAEGLPQRYQSQTWHGRRTAIRRTASEIRLPTMEGFPASGAVLLARGAGSSTRGLVRGSVRPDFVLLDDIQTRKDAESDRRRRVLADWIAADVMGLGGDRLLNLVMTSTPIVAGDLSEQFADKSLHPEWKTISYRLVESWPDAEDLWTRYDALWTDARADGDATFAEATAFYRDNREAMDEGGEVIDPGNFDARLELSGIQHARNLRLTMGEEAFAAEYQLKTRTAQSAVRVAPAVVASRLNGSPENAMPPGIESAVAFLDVNAKAGISWTVAGFGPGQTAAVLSYGRYPGDGRRLVRENATEAETQAAIAAGLAAALDRLLALRFVAARDDAAPEPLVAVWIDVGFERETVQRVCRLYRARGFRAVYGCQGASNQRYNPRGRNVVRRAFGVDFRTAEKGDKWFVQVSDIWKERVQRGFLAEPLQFGSCSLFGASPRRHAEFAAEICSEVLADKVKDSRGVDWYKWNLKPGAENHWLDTTGGCFAMASWYRLLDDAESVEAGLAGPDAAEEAGRAAFSVPPAPKAPPAAAPVPGASAAARIAPRRRPRLLRSTVA